MRRLWFALGIIACILAMFAGWQLSRMFSLQKQDNTSVEIVLEQMKAVSRLVTAEGYFSELYDYKDYYGWDVLPLRKKALMRVKAKVMLGFDLDSLDVTIDSKTKMITMTNPSVPEIIAIEHDVDYYDLSEGVFNQFSEADLNLLNAKAKDFIANVAMQSDLVTLATERKQEILETMGVIASTAGYELRLINDTQAISQFKPEEFIRSID